jgi:hypothetical protein
VSLVDCWSIREYDLFIFCVGRSIITVGLGSNLIMRRESTVGTKAHAYTRVPFIDLSVVTKLDVF